MRRAFLSLILLVLVASSVAAQKQNIKCPPASKLKSISDCPDTGCGNVDPPSE